jgi:predicted RNA binding protein YcfA (HicA-like mRNA interferase family)
LGKIKSHKGLTPKQAEKIIKGKGYTLKRQTKHKFYEHPETGHVIKVNNGGKVRVSLHSNSRSRPLYGKEVMDSKRCISCKKELKLSATKCGYCGSHDIELA